MKQLKIILQNNLYVFVVLALMMISPSESNAGSVIGELEYRYPCKVEGYRIEVRSDFGRGRESAGVQLNSNSEPEIVLNEKGSWELPRILLAFEYFSACILAREILFIRQSGGNADLRDVDLMREMIFEADCEAIYLLDEEGLLRGKEEASIIMEIFYYERSRDQYLGVRFPDRANNIQERCPI